MKETHKAICEDLFNKVSMGMTEIGRAMPVFLLMLPGDEVFPVILADMDMTVEGYAQITSNVATDMGAEAVILICEQIMVSREEGEKDLRGLLDGTIRPSELPDKKEYLTLMYVNIDGEINSIIAEIHSDPIGTRYTKDQKWMEEAVTNMIYPW